MRRFKHRITRDTLAVALGTYGFLVSVHSKTPSEVIVVASIGLIGSPAMMRLDERRKKRNSETDEVP